MVKSFFSFMKQFKDNNDHLGDLVNDMIFDSNFPKTSTSEKKIRDYFDSIYGKAPGFNTALDDALDLYKKYRS